MTEVVDKQTEFKFSELSQRAKDRAIQKHAEPDHDWWESTEEYYKTDADIRAQGFDIDKIKFSGFSSQGDGACWQGRVDMNLFISTHMTEPQDAAKVAIWQALYANADLPPYMEIETGGYYSHSNTMQIEHYGETYFGSETLINPGCSDIFALANAETIYNAAGGDEELARIYDGALEQAKKLADRIYKDLESEYDGYFDEENFADHCEANEWLFDEDGNLL